MTYAEFAAKQVSQKNVLIEIDSSSIQSQWFTYEPGIWQWKIADFRENITFNFGNGAFGYGAFGDSGAADLGSNAIIQQIGSLAADGVFYTKVSTLANLRAVEQSFLFDFGSQMVFVHFDDERWPETFESITLGVTTGYSTTIQAVHNDTLYEARVKSVPQVEESVDPLFFGAIAFKGGTVILENSDGAFDTFAQKDMYGQPVRIRLGFNDLEFGLYKTLMSGYIEDFDISETEIGLAIGDKRKALSQTISDKVFDITTYPYLEERDINKPIPLAYGTIKDWDPICVNKTQVAPGSYTFKLADSTNHGITSIDQVRVNGSIVVPASTNIATASFTLSTSAYDPNNRDKNEVRVDFTGYKEGTSAITNALDVAKDLLCTYANATYTNDFFDLVAWTTARNLCPSIGIVIEGDKLIEAIESICETVQGVFLITGAGKYSFRMPDETANPVAEIAKLEFLDALKATHDSREYISSVVVLHSRKWKDGSFKRYLYDTEEAALVGKYKIENRKEIETLLLSDADALALATNLMNRYGKIVPTFTVRTKNLSYLDLELFQTVNLEANRPMRDWYGRVKCELLGKSLNLDSNEVALTLRLIGEAGALVSTVDENPSFYGLPYYGEPFYGDV